MNLLVDDLPREIGGVPIDPDYRRMIQYEQLMADRELPTRLKLSAALSLLYAGPVEDVQAAWEGLLWFYRLGKEPEESGGKGGGKPVYDFEQDAGEIYAAFWQVYRIDLQETPLHWWAFVSLLAALPDSCLMGQIMRWRAIDTSKLKGAEKKRIQHLQQVYAIRRQPEQRMTLEERNAAYLARMDARYRQAQEWAKQQERRERDGKR